MKLIAVLLCLAGAISALVADDLTTTDGKTYKAYTVISHDEKGITIWCDQGQTTLPFEVLPAEIKASYGYKPPALDWSTDYEASRQLAKDQKKLLLLIFTGSDWIDSREMNQEVFQTAKFRDFASPHFLNVLLDFPLNKELPARLKKQNEGLRQKLAVKSYPTFVVLDSSGKELGRTSGYDPGLGPNYLIEFLGPCLSPK